MHNSLRFENDIAKAVHYFLFLQRKFAIEPPICIMISLLGMSGYTMVAGKYGEESKQFERDSLILPELIIHSYDTNLFKAMKHLFDMIWNAVGYPKSICYDEAGNRTDYAENDYKSIQYY